MALVSAVGPFGSMLGSLFAGKIAEIGRWRTLMLFNGVLAIGCATTLIKDMLALIIGRLLYGVSACVFSVLVPLFVIETAPSQWRGLLGGFNELSIIIGVTLAYAVS